MKNIDKQLWNELYPHKSIEHKNVTTFKIESKVGISEKRRIFLQPWFSVLQSVTQSSHVQQRKLLQSTPR